MKASHKKGQWFSNDCDGHRFGHLCICICPCTRKFGDDYFFILRSIKHIDYAYIYLAPYTKVYWGLKRHGHQRHMVFSMTTSEITATFSTIFNLFQYIYRHHCVCAFFAPPNSEMIFFHFAIFVTHRLRLHIFGTICHIEHKMTSLNWNIFRITGPLCGQIIGHRLIPLTKASDAELWRFLWPVPE